MIGCQAINFIGRVFNQSSYLVFWFLVQFVYFIALILFAYALWDYSPIDRVEPSHQLRLRTASRDLYEVVRAALVNRR